MPEYAGVFKWLNDENWKREEWEITCSILIDLLALNLLENNLIIVVAATQRPVATHHFFAVRNWGEFFLSFSFFFVLFVPFFILLLTVNS